MQKITAEIVSVKELLKCSVFPYFFLYMYRVILRVMFVGS